MGGTRGTHGMNKEGANEIRSSVTSVGLVCIGSFISGNHIWVGIQNLMIMNCRIYSKNISRKSRVSSNKYE
jgi:hypothetical protein